MSSSKKKKDFINEEEIGSQYGLYVKSGQQLEGRITDVVLLNTLAKRPVQGETPLKQIDDLETKIWQVDLVMRQSAIPFLKAATEQKYRRAASGYESLRRWAIWDCETLKRDLELQDPVMQANIAKDLELWLDLVFFEQALFLHSNSFGAPDVTPTHDKVLVIKAQPMPYGVGMGGPGVTPTSGGRTSTLPSQGPYPPQMDANKMKKPEGDKDQQPS